MFLVGLGDEATFTNGDVDDAGIVRGHSLGVSPAIVVTLIRDVIVERAAVVTNVWRTHCDVFNGAGLRFDRVGIGDRQRFAETLRAVGGHSRSGREVERIDVVCAVFFDNRDDALAHAGKDRSDHDRGHHSDYDPQNSQKAAKLIGTHVVERHCERFAGNDFW